MRCVRNTMDALQHDDQSVATLEENIARLRHLQAFGPLLSILPTCDEILLVVERCIETDRRPLLMTCKAMRKLVRRFRKGRRKMDRMMPDKMTSTDSASIQRLQWLRSLGLKWSMKVSESIAANAPLEVLQWAHANGSPLLDPTDEDAGHEHVSACCAARAGRLDSLKWMIKMRTVGTEEEQGVWLTNRLTEALVMDGARSGKIEVVKYLLQYLGVLPKEEPDALPDASEAGALEVPHRSPPPLRSNRFGTLILLGASSAGSLELLDWAVKHGAAPDTHEGCRTVCEDAGGNLAILRWARRHKMAWTNGHASLDPPVLDAGAGGMHNRILIEYLKNGGDVDGLRWLLDNGCPFDSNIECMVEAAGVGNLGAVRLLNERGCPWVRQDADGNIYGCGHPIAKAAEGGHLDVVRWLIENGCPRAEEGQEVDAAVLGGHLNVAQWLHARGVPLTSTAVFYAASFGRTDILEWLHKNGCPLTEGRPIKLEQLLHSAIEWGVLSTVQWLVAHLPTWDPLACLSLALQHEHDEIVEWILSKHLLPTLRGANQYFRFLRLGQSIKAICESEKPLHDPVANLSVRLAAARAGGKSVSELAEIANGFDFMEQFDR